MAALDNVELANERGFQRRVQYMLFEVAKDTATSTPSANDLAYIAGILNGEVSILQAAIGVLLNGAVESAGSAATDAQIKTALEQVWPSYATAWVARTV